MKTFLSVFLAACLLIFAVSCSSQHRESTEDGENYGRPDGQTDHPYAESIVPTPTGKTEPSTPTETTGGDNSQRFEYILQHMVAPEVELISAKGESIRLYTEMVYMETEWIFGDGYLVFQSVSSRLPEIADDLPAVEIGPSSRVTADLPTGASIRGGASFRLYSHEDYSLVLEADDMAEVYAFCLENAEDAPYYLYMTLRTTYKGITGSRQDAYFASVSAGSAVGESFDFAVCYAGWTSESEIYTNALNKDKMAISSVQHLPIYKVGTLEELEQFQLAFGNTLTMDSGYDEVPSFHDTVSQYDETFFKENSLLLVYVGASSGSFRFGVNSVFCDGDTLCVHVEQTNSPEICTDDMAGWLITVPVSDSMIENCAVFDADLDDFK